ncbi:Activin_recp domain-containing protein [Caenorhabditis elegans]|uniref:Activin_recp domain-containing protein n=1 Tax=Caenorhabditis elegans TaxID=6239 RepID=Q19249_CAEEL|nr:Activin_recp domain-containing protein [Caenorhabditis elegans]CCD68285.1 Activin_recp domain-containing protein [Caenorhabditis elegans]|eukprot:NP_508284.1 Uncharacterized protein CELE_F09E10.6 [Caenorhabditis elegans]
MLRALILTASLFGAIYTIRCYSGMQGSVNGDAIGEIELLDCNGTEFCLKLPSNGHVGRRHYEGAQYSCDFGECRREGCNKRDSGGTICCCSTDECNDGNNFKNKLILVFLTVLFLFFAFY